ncbi:DUF1304 domain-containing protein [Cellulomonas oligotrophica]|uniref:Membrane protein n=1 Tax=Cellulomonas oligotrophica TaxID=931536 RepID=A0A7Y9FKS1_9CELL|nr:DUF1304 domain-containing protein [Cellulomonas oligotrophica]NYD87886.1 putative membrane protein [Cellulomonas oligotrophica]GIG32907.1 membrane protein [Cellulomonas oligotrophica]
MLTLGLVLVALGALLHVWIFVLESLLWTAPVARRTFGGTPEQARATAEMAWNQGFYNLFLAVVAGVGVALVATGDRSAGVALVLAGAGSMVLAGVVLVARTPSRLRSGLTQAALPALGLVALAVALLG